MQPLLTKNTQDFRPISQSDKKYCQSAGFIYNRDMKYIKDNVRYDKILFYKDSNSDIQAVVIINNTYIVYKIKRIDTDYILTIKTKYKLPTDFLNDDIDLLDIDLKSAHMIFEDRGCDNIVTNFTIDNTISYLKNIFGNNFHPDVIYDILYLYTFLHSNALLFGYLNIDINDINIKITLNIEDLPNDELLNEIYDHYNYLYTFFTHKP